MRLLAQGGLTLRPSPHLKLRLPRSLKLLSPKPLCRSLRLSQKVSPYPKRSSRPNGRQRRRSTLETAPQRSLGQLHRQHLLLCARKKRRPPQDKGKEPAKHVSLMKGGALAALPASAPRPKIATAPAPKGMRVAQKIRSSFASRKASASGKRAGASGNSGKASVRGDGGTSDKAGGAGSRGVRASYATQAAPLDRTTQALSAFGQNAWCSGTGRGTHCDQSVRSRSKIDPRQERGGSVSG